MRWSPESREEVSECEDVLDDAVPSTRRRAPSSRGGSLLQRDERFLRRGRPAKAAASKPVNPDAKEKAK